MIVGAGLINNFRWPFLANQVITNGNFANGTTGWTMGSGGSLSVTNNILSLTCGTSRWFTPELATLLPLTATRHIFVRATVKCSTNGCLNIKLQSRDSGYESIGSTANNIATETKYTLYGIFTVPSGYSGNFTLGIAFDYGTASVCASANAQIDGSSGQGVIVIDMGTDISNPLYNLSASEMALRVQAKLAADGYWEGNSYI